MHTFGNTLFYPESERLEEYPSPHILKERILISTKPPEEDLESNNSKDKKKAEKNAIEKDKECSKDISDYKVSISHISSILYCVILFPYFFGTLFLRNMPSTFF